MGLARTAARVDVNQPEIVRRLRQVGASVQILSRVGDGCPDLVVGYQGRNFLMEVKDEGKGLNAKQIIWFGKWNGQKDIVRNFDEAFKVLLTR